MATNIVRFCTFLHNSMDVLSGRHFQTQFWVNLAFLLLVFFFFGYIGIWLLSSPDILMASVLCGGSIFVAIVVTMISTLMKTVKERSLDVAEVLIDGIEARDPNLNGHSRYVQNLVMCMWKYLPQEKRDKIPYAAKIIAVADTYSAITMKRSYKDSRSHEDTIGILNEVKGAQLDADLVDMFCKIPKGEIEACVPVDVDVLDVAN